MQQSTTVLRTDVSLLRTNVSCFNPNCSNLISISFEQKRDFNIEYYKKYKKYVQPFCSKKCEDEFFNELGEIDSLTPGFLKNHEFSLVVDGADTTKRLGVPKKYITASHKTELRARCLFEYLISLKPIDNKRCLTSMKVREYLIKGLPADLRIRPKNARQVTNSVMKKCKQLFPQLVSINQTERNYLELEFIGVII